MASRPPLGVSLADILGANPEPPKLGRGQLIAGVLADALAGAMGRPGQFAQALSQQRQSADENAQWGKRLMAQRLIEQALPDQSPMERDANAWAHMSEPEKQAYLQFQKAKEGDPIVTVTLPGDRIYSGPRSGLQDALMGGGGQATNRPPIGAVVADPRMNGGPVPQAPGGFPNGPYGNIGPYKRY